MSVLFQPLIFGAGKRLTNDMTGFVLSILIVTEAELERTALLLAEHVNVTPVVSVVRFDALQPLDEAMPDSASVTDQVTVTLLVYQPLEPAVPEIVGVITGAVLSEIVV